MTISSFNDHRANWVGRECNAVPLVILSWHELPGGIWLITLSFKENLLSDYPPRWVRDGNLMREMKLAGFRRLETFRRGNVTVNSFRRPENGNYP